MQNYYQFSSGYARVAVNPVRVEEVSLNTNCWHWHIN